MQRYWNLHTGDAVPSLAERYCQNDIQEKLKVVSSGEKELNVTVITRGK